MSSGIFRGKESSNRIELSRLVQDLLNCGVLGSLWLWGWGLGRCRWGVVGGAPHHTFTCMHMHAQAHTHTNTHVVNMITSCKWLPPLGESLGIPYDVICTCTCMHACVGGILLPPPTHIHPPPPPRGDPRNQSKCNSTWTIRDISILFKDLKSMETSPPMGGCIVRWVGGWVCRLMGGVRSKH